MPETAHALSSPLRTSLQLSADPSGAAQVRAWIVEALTEWGVDHLLEVAALLADELVANGVRHARTPMLVTARFDGRTLRVEVTDACPSPPVRLHVPVDATSGRGLNLVAALSAGWGVDRHPNGKTVWFEVR